MTGLVRKATLLSVCGLLIAGTARPRARVVPPRPWEAAARNAILAGIVVPPGLTVPDKADGLGLVSQPETIGLCRSVQGGRVRMSAVRPGSKGRGLRKPVEVDLGFSWGPRNSLVLGIGLVFLAGGYFALSRGSMTLAPALLVLAYCGLVPTALLIRAKSGDSGE